MLRLVLFIIMILAIVEIVRTIFWIKVYTFKFYLIIIILLFIAKLLLGSPRLF